MHHIIVANTETENLGSQPQLQAKVPNARPTHHMSVFPKEPLHMTNCMMKGIIIRVELWDK